MYFANERQRVSHANGTPPREALRRRLAGVPAKADARRRSGAREPASAEGYGEVSPKSGEGGSV